MKKKKVIIFVATIFLSVFFVKSEIMKTDSENISEAETIGTFEDIHFSKCKENAICYFNSQIASVASGHFHTLFLTTDGKLYSSGSSQGYGATGTGGLHDSSTTLELVGDENSVDGFTNDGSDPVIIIAAGMHHSMFVTASGIVYGFGGNNWGQLGSGDYNNATLPQKVSSVVDGFQNNGSDPVVKISAGMMHSIILTASGKVYTFGQNQYGQLGNMYLPLSPSTHIREPIEVSDANGFVNGGDDKAIDVEAGAATSIIITESGKIYGFGDSRYGQLGNGTTGDLLDVPVAVSSNGGFVNDGSDKVISASSGNYHTLFATASGKVYTFGDNLNGQLGNNSTQESGLPVAVSSGAGFINDGSDPVISVEAGSAHSLILTASGKVYTFGANSKGQLGTGNSGTQPRDEPVKVNNNIAEGFENGGSDQVVKIHAWRLKSFVITSSGNLYVFGNNEYGEFGIGSKTGSPIPTNGPLFNFVLNGKAITHSNETSNINKYSTDVVVKHVIAGATVKLSLDNGTSYTDVTGNFVGGEYTIGNAGTFLVNTGEEKTIRIKVEKDTNVQELTFIIDKKPPTITEIIGESGSSVCNLVDNKYYCNKDVGFTVVSYLSGIYSVEKKSDLGTEDITANIAAGLVNSFGGEILEKQKVIYTLIDGAGNIFTTDIILDNYIPRNELK